MKFDFKQNKLLAVILGNFGAGGFCVVCRSIAAAAAAFSGWFHAKPGNRGRGTKGHAANIGQLRQRDARQRDGKRSDRYQSVDGDTVVVSGGDHVRLLGIDADEKGYPCYGAARVRLGGIGFGKDRNVGI